MDILYWLRTNLPPSGSVIYILDISYLRILRGKVVAHINKESAQRIQSKKFALRGIEGILVGYEGNRIYRCKLDNRPDIVRVSSFRFKEGSEDFVDSNPLEVFDIPDLLDDSIDYSLSFEISKLLQTIEHSTTDKAEKPLENRYSAESDSDERSASNTIVVDYILVLDSLIEANISPLLLWGQLITRSQVTWSQSTVISALALLSVLMWDPDELITFENILESPES